MKLDFKPKSNLEKFGEKVFFLLVENFPRTFFVGGMVRDLLLQKKVSDIDIATQATPRQVANILAEAHITADLTHQRYGVVTAKNQKLSVEITTFRSERYKNGRYPKVKFITQPKVDSNRRDFTINSLYFSPIHGKVLDFQQGLEDLKKKQIKFIGNPEQRLKQDPLRLVRALRFAITLQLAIEKTSNLALKRNFVLLKKLSASRLQSEIEKIKDA
ncbi:MAG: CCA tRNA nucleotidyltransferase, partial [Patescibacteria group bacterium]|nr:CCA tRNA nucleotidyltransferase [Patescibacteria group bacterium]